MITKFYIIISRRNSGGRSQRISSAGGGSCLERIRFSWEAWNQTRVGIERNYVGIFIADVCFPNVAGEGDELSGILSLHRGYQLVNKTLAFL